MQRMEMNDREFKEWADNVARKKASVLSLLVGLPDYIMSGAAERNALEYEAAYTKLLDQVKDKSHDEKVAFLLLLMICGILCYAAMIKKAMKCLQIFLHIDMKIISAS